MQELILFPSHRLCRSFVRGAILLTLTTFIASSLFAKNVGIIIDRSKSVEKNNRDEAIDLVIELLQGDVSKARGDRWHLLKESKAEQDPYKLKLRNDLQNTIHDMLNGEKVATGIAGENFRLLTGHFGNLTTAHSLASEQWATPGSSFPSIIRNKAQSAIPSDPQTHFELARATVAPRMASDEGFYLFVVSDGVEDLENWATSKYLDAEKIKDPVSLAKGDFRNAGLARHLNALNAQHRATYSPSDLRKLSEFRKNYAELLVGRIALKSPEMLQFFQTQEKKVPVFIYVYHTQPRSKLGAQFVLPSDATKENPLSIGSTDTKLKWSCTIGGRPAPASVKRTLSLHNSAGKEIGSKSIEANSCNLQELSQDLEDGLYKVSLTIEAPELHIKPVTAVTYIEIKHIILSKPTISLSDKKYAEADNAKEAVTFDRTSGELLSTLIEWEYKSEDEIPPLKSLIKRIVHFEKGEPINAEYELIGEISNDSTSMSINNLLKNTGENVEPIPLGGSYRLILEAEWTNGDKASATTFFTLPKPELTILGKSGARESENTPRLVTKGDIIKIGNWMHGWDNFDYHLEIEQYKDDDWEPYQPSENGEPLKLSSDSHGAKVEVIGDIDEPIRYRVSFLPNKKTGLADILDEDVMSSNFGYVQSKGGSWMPYLFALFAVATCGFIIWHFASRR